VISLNERVQGKDLQRFLNSRGVGDACPTCQHGKLSIAVFDPEGEQEGNALAIRVVHLLDDGSRRGYGEFMRVCANCGHIHYIRDAEVLAFMEEESDNG